MKGLIFDLDGTLLDSMGMWHSLDRSFLRSHGITPPDDISEQVKTMTVEAACAYYASHFPLHMTPEEIRTEMEETAARAYREQLMLKPGAEHFLRTLAGRGIPFGLASATWQSLLEPALCRLGIRDLFAFLLTPESGLPDKHDPAVYLAGAALLHARPGEIAVIEDALYAARTAKAAGFYTVSFAEPTAVRDRAALTACCDRFAESWEALCTQEFLSQFAGMPAQGSPA